jgi:signal transduction histidine kinase
VETLLFRIAQEGFNNVIKHAHASEVWICLNYDDKPSLTIRDNGIGFDLSTVTNGTAWGLIGMQERANLMNATVRLDSTPGQGMTLVVRLDETMS